MKIHITKQARKDIINLQAPDKKKIERVLLAIKQADTIHDIPNVIKVKGTQSPIYRIKITPYRVFFIEVSKVVTVLEIGRRNEGLYILPSGIETAGLTMELSSQAGREYVLQEAIQQVIPNLDYIIIDTPPDLSLLSQNAWTTSDRVIIPVQCEYYALLGLDQLIGTIQTIQHRIKKNLALMGLLPTLYDKRRDIHTQALEKIKEAGYPIFDTIIRTNTALSEAPIKHKTIQEYDSSSNGAKDYTSLVKEILSHE